MTNPNFMNEYCNFVDQVTSDPSKNLWAYVDRLKEIHTKYPTINFARLDTGATGLNAEAGELLEIVKKVKFQGKPLEEDAVVHLKKELGDCFWYIAQVCLALNVSMEEIMTMNVEKLKARYPDVSFSVERSENRKVGDI